MSEKRFTVMKKFDGSYVICDKGKMLVADDCCDLLNELNKDFKDCEKLLDSKDDFIHKFKRDIEELGISIKLFEDDIATKDKKIEEQQATIQQLKERNAHNFAKKMQLMKENEQLRQQIEQLNLAIDDLASHTSCDDLRKENEQLRKQIQNYEQLISNSYVGVEETLDGFVGKYVIWENELQNYKEKIKGVFNE